MLLPLITLLEYRHSISSIFRFKGPADFSSFHIFLCATVFCANCGNYRKWNGKKRERWEMRFNESASRFGIFAFIHKLLRWWWRGEYPLVRREHIVVLSHTVNKFSCQKHLRQPTKSTLGPPISLSKAEETQAHLKREKELKQRKEIHFTLLKIEDLLWIKTTQKAATNGSKDRAKEKRQARKKMLEIIKKANNLVRKKNSQQQQQKELVNDLLWLLSMNQ